MDTRQSPDTGASMGRGGGLRSQPIAEYLRHVSRDGRTGEADLLLTLPPKLYRVSEIAEHLDITRQTVHNYATIGLITEERRTPGGQRLFDASVFGRLHEIQRLKRTHRLHEIRRIFDRRQHTGPSAGDAGGTSDAADASPFPARDPQPKDT